MKLIVPVLMDLLMVLVFALIGRLSHGEADDATGVLTTAWPFGCAALIGWLVTIALWRPVTVSRPYAWRPGLVVWVSTVILGMVLRLVAGRTAAWPFWIVAFISFGVLMLGWRLFQRLVGRRRRVLS